MGLNFDLEKIEKIVEVITSFVSIKSFEGNLKINFSIYQNGIAGSGKTEFRKFRTIENLSTEEVLNLLKEVPKNCELAINSKIEVDGKAFHLGFIDFNYEIWDKYFEEKLWYFKNIYNSKIHVFQTGRSFHGYQDILLPEDLWYKYLGNLLLLNKNDTKNDIVDSRWIGHSLCQGFSALRISSNTNSYLISPTFEKEI